MMAAHDAVTTSSRNAQQKLGKLVTQGSHASHGALLEQLPETARPPGPDAPLGGGETKVFAAKARYRSLPGAGATACLRARPTDSLRVIPAAEFVGIGRRFRGIEEHVTMRYPCCDAVDVDTRHARICPRIGAQMNQHQPLLLAISRTLKRLGIPHQVESSEPITADRNLRMDIVIRRGGLRDAPNREYRVKSILLNVTHAYLQAQVHLRRCSADHDGPGAFTSEACKCQHQTHPGHLFCRRTESRACHSRGGKLWAPRGRGRQLQRPAGS